jgi:hypothetical protein
MQFGRPLLDALDRMGYGGLILDTSGQVVLINATGIGLLKEHGNARYEPENPNWSRDALKSLLRARTADRFRMNEDNWVALRRTDGERPLVLRAVPIAEGEQSGPHTVVILLDLEATPEPQSEALQKLFGLSRRRPDWRSAFRAAGALSRSRRRAASPSQPFASNSRPFLRRRIQAANRSWLPYWPACPFCPEPSGGGGSVIQWVGGSRRSPQGFCQLLVSS